MGLGRVVVVVRVVVRVVVVVVRVVVVVVRVVVVVVEIRLMVVDGRTDVVEVVNVAFHQQDPNSGLHLPGPQCLAEAPQ